MVGLAVLPILGAPESEEIGIRLAIGATSWESPAYGNPGLRRYWWECFFGTAIAIILRACDFQSDFLVSPHSISPVLCTAALFTFAVATRGTLIPNQSEWIGFNPQQHFCVRI